MNDLTPISKYRQPMFASRGSVPEAMDYVGTMASAAGGSAGIAVYTAALVLLNTVIEELERAELRSFETTPDWEDDIPF